MSVDLAPARRRRAMPPGCAPLGRTKALALVLSLVLLPGCFVSRFYATDWPKPFETHQVHTSDGWTLDLKHVAPLGGPHRARPVILMHGIDTNGRNMDLDEKHSLALYLARRGFDVWVPSLRGVGQSEKRPLTGPAGQEDFDDYVDGDLPAIISYVRAHTGGGEVDWVGHSMGGMVLYAYLAKGGGGIARAVTLGSPVRLAWTGKLDQLVRAFAFLAPYASWAPIEATTHLTLPLQDTFDGPIERLLISPENTTPQTWRRLLAVGMDDLPGGLVAQFAGWVERDSFDSRDHRLDYLAGLRHVHVPMLVVAGKIDGIAPPWAVRPAYEALGSKEKRWLVLGEANGQSADYNHMDMLLGERAATDLWGRIAAFLAH